MALLVTLDGTENPVYQNGHKVVLGKNGARYEGREIEYKEIAYFVDYEKPILVEQYEDNSDYEEYIIDFLNRLNESSLQNVEIPETEVIKIENKNLIFDFNVSVVQKPEKKPEPVKTESVLKIKESKIPDRSEYEDIKLNEWMDFRYQKSEAEPEDEPEDEIILKYIF